MSRTQHIEAACAHCDRTYQQEQTQNAVWADSGRSLGGFDGEHWYGYDDDGNRVTIDDPETDDRVELVWLNVYAYGGPYDCCPACADRYFSRQGETDYYDSDLAPSWFDPEFAGESWE